MKIATAEEAATKDIKKISQHGSPQVYTVKQTSWPRRGAYRGQPRMPHQPQARQPCDRCGLKNHTRDKCWYRDKECFNCGKVGHLKVECRSEKRTRHNPQNVSNLSRTHYVEQTDHPNETEFETAIFGVTERTPESSATKPYTVPVEIEGISLELELDMGVAVSIVSYTDYNKYFCHIPLSYTTRHLHVYLGSPLQVAGEIIVSVKYNRQEYKLPLVVVKTQEEAPPLFGRSWL